MTKTAQLHKKVDYEAIFQKNDFTDEAELCQMEP
jgi:hypothetical protein